MASLPRHETALHYCVDDLPGAHLPGARLQNVLDALQLGRPVTRLALDFLRQQGLEVLHGLAIGTLSYEEFRKLALAEQNVRIEAVKAADLVREAESKARDAALQAEARLAREQADAARIAREKDPKFIAKARNMQLRGRYGVDVLVDEDCFNPLMQLLRKLDARQRLSEEDFVWLSSVGKEYFSDQIRVAYHSLEADFLAKEFEKTKDPWMAVNASGHYRKSGRALDADSMLGGINVEKQKSTKLKSALCTTRGGVKRDLGDREEALRLGEKAHVLQPGNYRPCTLLGAIHMEAGNFGFGQEWYAKAVERGATLDFVDQDLRNIFFRADQARQAELKAFLLEADPSRYAWVNARKAGQSKATSS